MKNLTELCKEQCLSILEVASDNSNETIINDLEVTYTTKSGSLYIQVPENYTEDNIQLYLDNISSTDMPGNDEDGPELFGQENYEQLIDVYFSYDRLTIPEDATIKPDVEWDKRYDNKQDPNAKLTLYSIDNIQYILRFEKFIVDTMNKNLDNILKDLFKNSESNSIHPWLFEIHVENINYRK